MVRKASAVGDSVTVVSTADTKPPYAKRRRPTSFAMKCAMTTIERVSTASQTNLVAKIQKYLPRP